MLRRLGFTITGRNSVPNYAEVSFAVHPDLSLFHFVSLRVLTDVCTLRQLQRTKNVATKVPLLSFDFFTPFNNKY